MPPAPSKPLLGRLLGTTAVVVLGTLLSATYLQTCLSSKQLSSNFMSPAALLTLVKTIPQSAAAMSNPDIDFLNLPFLITLVPCTIFAIAAWLGGAIWLVAWRGMPWGDALARWGWY